MPIWFNWSPLAPLIERYFDDGSRDLCEAEVTIGDTGVFKVALVGSRRSIELIRVATLDSDGNLSPKQAETVSKLVDQMLAVIRLAHDPQADLLRLAGTDQTISLAAPDDNGKPRLSINIGETGQREEVDPERIRNVFLASIPHWPLFKLLADAHRPELPQQYRYLSLYKILELEFRSGSKWVGLSELLSPHEQSFQALNISKRKFENFIDEMRAKCAHIKVGNRDQLGIVGLDGEEAKLVFALIPFLSKIIAAHLTTRYPNIRFVPIEDARLDPVPRRG